MALIETVWTNGDFIPKSGLIAWHAADTAANGQDVDDASGNGRHIGTGPFTTPPILVPDVINGLPAIEFDGVTHDPLKYSSAIPNIKTAFVVAAYADAAFPAGAAGNAGLLTGITLGDVLVGNVSTTRFFDFNYDSLGPYSYKRRDAPFTEPDMQAAFNNDISIFEVEVDTIGFVMDGIQVGMQRDFAGRLWKGYWCEQILYSRILETIEKQQVYEYFAMKYLLWKQVSSGLNVWPFQPDWPLTSPVNKLVLGSTSVSGATKARSKSTMKRTFDANFGDREPEEYDAAEIFWNEHYPGERLIFRDDSFVPSRDTEVRLTSQFGRQNSNHRQIGYAIQATQV